MSRPCGLLIDGTDLGTQFGLILEDPGDWLDHAPVRYRTGYVYGEDYTTILGVTPEAEAREYSFSGVVKAATNAALVTAVDGIKRFLANGEVDLSTNFDTTRYYKARLLRAPVVAFAPQFAAPAARITATLTCADPMAWASSNTTVNFTSSPAACALGTAISRPTITITGAATNPLITYANSAGATQETLGFTLTLGGSDTLVIDCARKTVTKTISSVSSNAIADITTNTAYTFLALDPADGVQLTSAWPTIKVSSGSGAAVYAKRYR